ncbi:unnamed protein product [Miscanthus lutarioriparius]|uniref:NB-ARC domain-containing protein n=1 Tax=Miscanthus lutarioriparius TaxID=422564 RepID=A0A811NLN8_9POAL|nr:unnamed protein product [Miscanthus lutarioriparius]
MDILLSSVLGDLTSRSINFFTSKVSNRTLFDVKDRLHKVLLRAQVIIDEAMGRHITNQAMIIQLGMLRDAVHRGYYMLDTYIYQPNNEEEAKDQVMRQYSSSLSIVNSVKRLCLSSRGDCLALKELQEMVDNLSSMIVDANELVLFLTSYPRLYRQPYSMHLQLAYCMFGRQMEAQQVINFLLHQQPNSVEELDVMPIVGAGHVGKSTLVAHVCKDERVRAHFSGILYFDIQGFADDDLAAFKDECELKHRNLVSESNLEVRLLIVIELIGDINEDSWSRLYSTSKEYAPKGSKIIVTSRFENIVKYGTAQTLTMKHLSHEAFWYFFKTLTFGSMDPKMHPRLTHMAMEIARMILAVLRGYIRNHFSRFDEHPCDRLNQNRPALIMRLTTSSQEIVGHRYQRFSEEEVPTMKLQDVIYGSVKVDGKFEVLAWRSPIPPYYSYVHTCNADLGFGCRPECKYRMKFLADKQHLSFQAWKKECMVN